MDENQKYSPKSAKKPIIVIMESYFADEQKNKIKETGCAHINPGFL